MKNITIYRGKGTRVYINQCHADHRKTKVFAIRKDGDRGLAYLIAMIRWDGAWRQYVFEPEGCTKWSSGCQKEITKFLDKINKQHRDKLKKEKKP